MATNGPGTSVLEERHPRWCSGFSFARMEVVGDDDTYEENAIPNRGRKKEVLPLPVDYILKCFKYEEGDDPSLPIVRMDKPRGRKPTRGVDGNYRSIYIQGKLYRVSRTVWALVNGVDIPHGFEIDHRDRNPGGVYYVCMPNF